MIEKWTSAENKLDALSNAELEMLLLKTETLVRDMAAILKQRALAGLGDDGLRAFHEYKTLDEELYATSQQLKDALWEDDGLRVKELRSKFARLNVSHGAAYERLGSFVKNPAQLISIINRN